MRQTDSRASAILEVIHRRGVVIDRPDEVKSYLARHRRLAAVLPRVCRSVRDEFGAKAELALKLYRDPEIRDRYLTLYVRQSRYAADIMDRLHGLSESFEELTSASGYLLITTDFRKPEKIHAMVGPARSRTARP